MVFVLRAPTNRAIKKLFLCTGAVFYFLFFFGCSPASSDDFLKEGQAYCRILLTDLKKIQTREDLYEKEALLQKRFNKLVDLMIEARKFQEENPEDGSLDSSLEKSAIFNAALSTELERIYKIEGGKEVIERTQREALIRLDAFEKNTLRQRNKLSSFSFH